MQPSHDKFKPLIEASQRLSDSISAVVKFTGTGVSTKQKDELGLLSNLAHDLIHDAGAIRMALHILEIDYNAISKPELLKQGIAKIPSISTDAIKNMEEKISPLNIADRMYNHAVVQLSDGALEIMREICAAGKEVALQIQAIHPEKKAALDVIAQSFEEKISKSYGSASKAR